MEPRDALAGEIRSLLLHLSRILQDRTPSQGACESMIVGADRLHRLMAMLVDAVPGLERNLPLMESAIQHLDNALSLINTGYSEVLGLSSPVFYSGARGRPRIVVSPPVLEYLISNRFSVRQVAQLLQVSPSTIRRHMNEFGITVRGTYSSLSNEMLDTIVQRIQEEHPNSGYRLITGHLAAMGYRVQETRVRDSIRRVDPVGVAHRWIRGIRRRTYSVPSPNALWHMDGNHKLIRWKLVIHAAIDGFSRLPVFCHCSNNNRADTVLSLFIQAVQQYGLPSRVRCDRGGENSLVGYYLLSHPLRGPGRGSVISGRSIHNQRIERFWRDLYTGCTALFYHLFYHMEDTGLFDCDSELQLWCLHFIYIPYINHSLRTFVDGWSSHPMSSARGFSPLQMWIHGMLSNYSSGHRVTQELYHAEDSFVNFGIDWESPIPSSDDHQQVDVPIIEAPPFITDALLDTLRNAYTLDRILSSTHHAVDVYVQLLEQVMSLMPS